MFGHPTLSRPVQRLLARADVEVVSVPARGRWPGRPYPVDGRARRGQRAAEADDAGWLEEWRTADRALGRRIDAFVAEQPDLTPYDVAAAVNAANPPGGLLVVGASNPIRDLDLMATAHPVGERRMVIANRGLAGIDGTVSTAIGAALGRPHSTRAIAYVGDVTFLHDATALVLGPREQRPDLTIVVANDDGGSIFATLEQGAPSTPRATSSSSAPPTASTWPPLRRHPRRTGGSGPRRAGARAGQSERGDRGGRGRGPPRQPPGLDERSAASVALTPIPRKPRLRAGTPPIMGWTSQ